MISNFWCDNFRTLSKIPRSDSSTRQKKGYSLENAHRLQRISRQLRKLVAMLYWPAATSQIHVLEFLYIRQRAILNWPREIVRSHLQLQLQPQGAFLLSSFCIGLLWVDRSFRGSSETTNCWIYPYQSEEMNPWPFQNWSRDFWDLVKLVHRKKAISCSWVAIHLGNYKIQKNRKDG